MVNSPKRHAATCPVHLKVQDALEMSELEMRRIRNEYSVLLASWGACGCGARGDLLCAVVLLAVGTRLAALVLDRGFHQFG